jgi:site-specific DNA-cytosine methylase
VALVQAEVDVILQVELDKEVRKVLNDQFPNVPERWNVAYLPVIKYHLDICTITFPCNATSSAGPRTGMKPSGNAAKVRCSTAIFQLVHNSVCVCWLPFISTQ